MGTSPEGATSLTAVLTRHSAPTSVLPLPATLSLWYLFLFLFLLIPADFPSLIGAQETSLACKREWDACCGLLLTNARRDTTTRTSWFVFFLFHSLTAPLLSHVHGDPLLLLLAPLSHGALSLPLPLFAFWFVPFFSFSFTADRSLSLTGVQGPPLAHKCEGGVMSPFFVTPCLLR